MTPVQGRCLCGGVRFEVTEPFIRVSQCHCTFCKAISGGYGTVSGRAKTDAIRVLEGRELLTSYTPEGGSIHVKVEADKANNCVMIHVEDTGVGIDPDNLPHIFQPFFRVMSEVEGTGLGLSIAREIIELHDGAIEVKSVMGEGSTFTVRLGLLPQPAAANMN